MPLIPATGLKLAVGVLAATVFVGGGAAAVHRAGAATSTHRSGTASIAADGTGAALVSDGGAPGADSSATLSVDPALAGASAVAAVTAPGKAGVATKAAAGGHVTGTNPVGGNLGVTAGSGGITGGTGTGTAAVAAPNQASGGASGGATVTPPPATTTGGDSGGSGGGGPSGVQLPGATVTTPAPPSDTSSVAVPNSAYEHGSASVVVPGTDRVSKKLCVIGTVANKCETLTVPAVQAVTLTVSYSGNASTVAPTFTPGTCSGGASVAVAGVTPGTTVSADVNGRRVSVTVPSRGETETASLCDAG